MSRTPRLDAVRSSLVARTVKSRELSRQRAEILNAGFSVSSGMPHPIFIECGRGSRVFDADGNSYIDTSVGFGLHVLGHRHDADSRRNRRARRQGLDVRHPHDVADGSGVAVPRRESVRGTRGVLQHRAPRQRFTRCAPRADSRDARRSRYSTAVITVHTTTACSWPIRRVRRRHACRHGTRRSEGHRRADDDVAVSARGRIRSDPQPQGRTRRSDGRRRAEFESADRAPANSCANSPPSVGSPACSS